MDKVELYRQASIRYRGRLYEYSDRGHFYFVAEGQSYFDEKGHIFPPTGVNLHRLFQHVIQKLILYFQNFRNYFYVLQHNSKTFINFVALLKRN